ncbi:hypothetical protein [Pseudoalteromonas xiamenensis]
MKRLMTLSIFTSALLLSACSSTEKTNASEMGMTIPSWVTNPTIEKGFAASSCVLASNSFSLDKSQAAMLARDEIAKQIDTRLSSLQEAFSKKAQLGNENLVKETFSQTIANFTDQSLQGTIVEKVDYAQMGDNKNVCVLVTLPEEKAKRLFEMLIAEGPTKLDPENEALLYLNFIKSENKL